MEADDLTSPDARGISRGQKKCPECQAILAIAFRNCKYCNYTFPKKSASKAAKSAIAAPMPNFKDDDDDDDEEVKRYMHKSAPATPTIGDEDSANARTKRNSAKAVKYKYEVKIDSDDEVTDDERPDIVEWHHPADADEDELRIESFLGRRINRKTLQEEFRVKFRGKSFFATEWLSRHDIEHHPTHGRFDRTRLQRYEKKLAEDGVDELHDVDELKDIILEIDHVMNHRTVTRPLIDNADKLGEMHHPETVTLDFLNKRSDEALTRYAAIVGRLVHESEAEPFLEPVNVTEVEDYLEYVMVPMDLGTISKRLENGYYRGLRCHVMFASDVRLVFRNCKLYNEEGSDIWKAADYLEQFFERLYSEWITSPMAWPAKGDKHWNWAPWLPGCTVCKEEKDASQSILCDCCDAEYHLYCLDPPLAEVPTGTWLCQRCLDKGKRDAMKADAVAEKVEDNKVVTPPAELEVTEYLVKWKGLPYKDCTWEKEQVLSTLPESEERIIRYKTVSAVPSEEEIYKTTCQQPCCLKQPVVRPEDLLGLQGGRCNRQEHCLRPAGHFGRCSRAPKPRDRFSVPLERQEEEFTNAVYDYVEKIKAQVAAFSHLATNSVPPEQNLQECGVSAVAWIYEQKSESPSEVCEVLADMVQFLVEEKALPSQLIKSKKDNLRDMKTEYHVNLVKDPLNGLGMSLTKEDPDQLGVQVVGFHSFGSGQAGPAERCGVIRVGDYILAVNDEDISRLPFYHVVHHLKASEGSVKLTFQTKRYTEKVSPLYSPTSLTPFVSDLQNGLPYRNNKFNLLPSREESSFVSQLDQLSIPHDEVAGDLRQVVDQAMATHLANLIEPLDDGEKLEDEDAGPDEQVDKSSDEIKKEDGAKALEAEKVSTTVPEKQRFPFRAYQKSPEYKSGNMLFSYQVEGLNWILRGRSLGRNLILADEMGLGKTVQVVTSLEHIRTKDSIRGPFLVIVPLSTIQHWKREFENWTEMNVCLYHESSGMGSKGKEFRPWIRQHEWFYPNVRRSVLKYNVLLTTYETILSDYEDISWVHWRYLVVDEAHRLKSQNSKVLRMLKTMQTDYRLLLTGTPLQNNTQELWTLMNFIEPQKFGDKQDFDERYGNLQTQDQVLQLQAEIAPHILRRVKEDVEKCLPPKEETIIDVELTILQKRYYRAIFEKNRSFLQRITKGVTPQLLNIHMELRKCCNHPFLIKGVEDRELEEYGEIPTMEQRMKKVIECSGKLVLVDKLLPKLKREGHKVLIFSQFVILLDILEEYCHYKNYKCERLDGSVQGIERQAGIDRFSNPDSDSFLFLLSTRAGGVGINLVAADTVIIFDSDWNPQNDVQAQARCHRIGQEKAVKVYRLVTKKTFESEMFERASRKLGLEHAVLGTVSFSETSKGDKLSTEELEILLRQGAYAMMDENEDESKRFVEQDIEQILQENAHVHVVERVKTASSLGHKVDRSSFSVNVGDQNISLDDPDFWQKVLPEAINAEMLLAKLEDGTAFDTTQQRATFIRHLKTAIENLSRLKLEGRVDSREFDMACELLRRVSVMKKQFTLKQTQMAASMLEQLQSTMTRSCRVKPKFEDFADAREERSTKKGRVKKGAPKRKAAVSSSDIDSHNSDDGDDDGEGEEDGSNDLCALCGEGGLILICDGPCMRSFHPECLNMEDEPDDDTWMCPDCDAGKHMCLLCGNAGRDNAKGGVFKCQEDNCGRFYHAKCVNNSSSCRDVEENGAVFICPQHTCAKCGKHHSDHKKNKILQCIRCPAAYHQKCIDAETFIPTTSSSIVCPTHLEGKKVLVMGGNSYVYDEEESDPFQNIPEESFTRCKECKKLKRSPRECRVALRHNDTTKPVKSARKRRAKPAGPRAVIGLGRCLECRDMHRSQKECREVLKHTVPAWNSAEGREGTASTEAEQMKEIRSRAREKDRVEETPVDEIDQVCALCNTIPESVRQGEHVEGPFLTKAISVQHTVQKREKVWVHQFCAERSPEVFVDENGVYRNVGKAVKRGRLLHCATCRQRGATIGCFLPACKKTFHLLCAIKSKGAFAPNADSHTVYFCDTHADHADAAPLPTTSPTSCVCGLEYQEEDEALWIGCDVCERWFHAKCMGLSDNDAEQLTSWVCPHCTKDDGSVCATCGVQEEDGTFYIGCDICARWFHPTCVNLTTEAAKELPAWTCGECESEAPRSRPRGKVSRRRSSVASGGRQKKRKTHSAEKGESSNSLHDQSGDTQSLEERNSNPPKVQVGSVDEVDSNGEDKTLPTARVKAKKEAAQNGKRQSSRRAKEVDNSTRTQKSRRSGRFEVERVDSEEQGGDSSLEVSPTKTRTTKRNRGVPSTPAQLTEESQNSVHDGLNGRAQKNKRQRFDRLHEPDPAQESPASSAENRNRLSNSKADSSVGNVDTPESPAEDESIEPRGRSLRNRRSSSRLQMSTQEKQESEKRLEAEAVQEDASRSTRSLRASSRLR